VTWIDHDGVWDRDRALVRVRRASWDRDRAWVHRAYGHVWENEIVHGDASQETGSEIHDVHGEGENEIAA
jgi:hypothetical protein